MCISVRPPHITTTKQRKDKTWSVYISKSVLYAVEIDAHVVGYLFALLFCACIVFYVHFTNLAGPAK